MEIAIMVPGELMGHVYLADELSIVVSRQRGPKPLVYMAMRACRHGLHLYLLIISFLVEPTHFHATFIRFLCRVPVAGRPFKQVIGI
jgi:hypothetical protein